MQSPFAFAVFASFLVSAAGHVPEHDTESPAPPYVDVAARVGLVHTPAAIDVCRVMIGTGSAWADVDGDQDIDLFTTSMGGPNRLYLNEGDLDGDGLPDFLDVAGFLAIEEPTRESMSSVFIDYDNDGDQDLYVTHKGGGGNTLWENRLADSGQLAFVDVTARAGIADDGRCVTSAWADFDADGWLDLYVAKHAFCMLGLDHRNTDRLYHANGDGTFDDWTRFLCDGLAPRCDDVDRMAFTAGWLDYDNDGDLDLYVVNDAIFGYAGNRHWRNDGPDGDGGWTFTEISVSAGTNIRLNGMGLGVGDIDNDGWLDLAFSNILESCVLRNEGDGTYENITYPCGVGYPTEELIGWATVFFDADNDGWLDLYFVNGPLYLGPGQPNQFFLNTGGGDFLDLSAESGLDSPGNGRNASIVDFDGDGWVDVLVTNVGQLPQLYLNLGSRRQDHHWLTVTVEGTDSNRDGIGTRLWLTTADGRQLREISSGPTLGGGDYRAAYFGLGQRASGKLRVRWPNGVRQDVGIVSADQELHLVEPRAGLRRPLTRRP